MAGWLRIQGLGRRLVVAGLLLALVARGHRQCIRIAVKRFDSFSGGWVHNKLRSHASAPSRESVLRQQGLRQQGLRQQGLRQQGLRQQGLRQQGLRQQVLWHLSPGRSAFQSSVSKACAHWTRDICLPIKASGKYQPQGPLVVSKSGAASSGALAMSPRFG